jgi:hypothetical protein
MRSPLSCIRPIVKTPWRAVSERLRAYAVRESHPESQRNAGNGVKTWILG